MANTIDQDDPLVGWTCKQAVPTDGSLTAGQLKLRQFQRACGNPVDEDFLPSSSAQTAAGQTLTQANFFLVVADNPTEVAAFQNGTAVPTRYAQWVAEADPA